MRTLLTEEAPVKSPPAPEQRLDAWAGLLSASPVGRAADGELSGVKRVPALCPDAHLGKAFCAAAEANPAQSAFVGGKGTWSYGRLKDAALRIAETLRMRPDFSPGDRVVLLLENSPDYAAAFYGALLAEGIAVPLPPDVEWNRLQTILASSEARHVLTTSAVMRRRKIAFTETAAVELSEPAAISGQFANATSRVGQAFQPASGTGPIPQEWHGKPAPHSVIDLTTNKPTPNNLAGGDETAAIFFTSGSTGEPKGVVLSHRNLLSNAAAIGEYLSITADERALAVLPFYHAFGNSVLQTHLLSGATLVLDGSPVFLETLLDAIEKHQVTSLSGVPDLFRLLLTRTSLGNRPLPSLRYMAAAGGALPIAHARELAEKIAPAKLFIMYGQTEATARLSYLPPELLPTHLGSIGTGLSNVELQVVDEQGMPIKPGEIGEIRARGPNVMLGYWKDPAATAKVIRDGWLYTGDLATIDEQGFIFPRGRANNLMKIGGFRFHPREVEEFVARNFPVVQAAAVAFESPEKGTRLALFVQLQDGTELTADAVARCCADGLPRHMLPEYIEFVADFPLNDAMKLDRQRLSRQAAERSGPRSVPTDG